MSDVEGRVKQRYYCSSQGDTQVRSRPIHKALYSDAGWKPLRGRKADADVLTGCFLSEVLLSISAFCFFPLTAKPGRKGVPKPASVRP